MPTRNSSGGKSPGSSSAGPRAKAEERQERRHSRRPLFWICLIAFLLLTGIGLAAHSGRPYTLAGILGWDERQNTRAGDGPMWGGSVDAANSQQAFETVGLSTLTGAEPPANPAPRGVPVTSLGEPVTTPEQPAARETPGGALPVELGAGSVAAEPIAGTVPSGTSEPVSSATGGARSNGNENEPTDAQRSSGPGVRPTSKAWAMSDGPRYSSGRSGGGDSGASGGSTGGATAGLSGTSLAGSGPPASGGAPASGGGGGASSGSGVVGGTVASATGASSTGTTASSTSSVAGGTTPATGGTSPVTADTNVATGGTTPPTGGTTPPTDGTTPPTGGTTPPTGGTTPPTGGTTPPTGGTTPPTGGTTPPTGGIGNDNGQGHANHHGQPPSVVTEERINTVGPLKGVQPLRPDLSAYIVDKLAAQQLGKALFWDSQVGSHGVACASCHFHAGADIRTKNQVSPGLKAGDTLFDQRGSAAEPFGPNKSATPKDFPIRKLTNIIDRDSDATFDSNDVVSSQGSLGGDFISSNRGHMGRVGPTPNNGRSNVLQQASQRGHGGPRSEHAGHGRQGPDGAARLGNEKCTLTYDPQNNTFHTDNLIHRRVEPRQTPTAVNAVFNFRQFWDGRANQYFNGVDPFGARTFVPRDPATGLGNPNAAKAGTLVMDSTANSSAGLSLQQILIEYSSLASQAVGPPLSDFEMSCGGKSFADLGRKLIPLRALASQKVHIEDSLFSQSPNLISGGRRSGLTQTYRALIERAFHPKFWNTLMRVSVGDDGSVVPDANGFTQMEHNFSLFWGLAIQEYEALLISDDSPFDRAKTGNPAAMSEEAKAGEVVFLGKGGCVGCHAGPVFSGATRTARDAQSLKVLERMRVGSGSVAFYDGGYYNIGVRPTAEDVGVGASDPYGFDLSFVRQFKWRQLGQTKRSPDAFDPTPCKWVFQYWPCQDVPQWFDPLETERDAVDGAFKTPILRNVGLNPPYFHNGGQSNLKDVVRFYNRGGDRRGSLLADTSGRTAANPFGQINESNLHPDIGEASPEYAAQKNAIGLTEPEQHYLVQFLLSLTDERVACHADVFDHPELPLQMGHENRAVPGTQIAKDIIRTLPAVGARGLKQLGKPCFPNSGDLFGSVNAAEPTPLQPTFMKILEGTTPADTREAVQNAEIAAALFTSTGTTTSTAGSGGTGGTAGGGTGGTTGGTTGGATGGADTGTGGLGGVPGDTIRTVAGSTTGTTAIGTIFGQLPRNIATAGSAGPGNPAVPGAANLLPLPPPVPAPVFTGTAGNIKAFTQIGFLQDAKVSNDACPDITAKRQWGGTAVINSTEVTIPCNTVLQMPAATLTWAELFPESQGGAGTEAAPLALKQSSQATGSGFRFPSIEIRAIGNIVNGTYIAGLVFISQQSLNAGAGTISAIDYENGVMYVANKNPAAPPIRLQINDAKSRFSKGQSPDQRFNVDDANPTIRAVTGYPMCIPRTDPAVADDPLCPARNRPRVDRPDGCRTFAMAGVVFPARVDLALPVAGQTYCTGFVMGDPATAGPDDPTSKQQAPFKIGDFITYSGTLLRGDRKDPAQPDTISAHTVTANVGIFTQPGTLPSYLAIGEFRVAATAPIDFINGVLQEEQDRIVLEAFTTDVSAIVDIYMVDVDPQTGRETQRWVTPATMTSGVGGPASNGQLITGGITTQFTGPVPGRVRLRANRAVPGILNSPTRFVRVVARTLCDPANINGVAPLVGAGGGGNVDCLARAPAANGLLSGQYMAPTVDYIFPETIVPGDPQPANNFWDLGFLVNGEGPGTGRLTPTPW